MLTDAEPPWLQSVRAVVERHLSPMTGELDWDSTLAELKATLDIRDERSLANLEGWLASLVEQDYPPTPAQAARGRAQRRRAKINELRSGHVEAWRNDDDLF
jgi:hypothetical protein